MRPKKQSGLTLLEVLVALSIFSIIGVTSYRLLNTVIDSQKINLRQSELLVSIQKTMLLLDRDFQFTADRSIRTNQGVKPALILDDKYLIEFTRSGWRNPLQLQRSQLQRVAYDVGLHPDHDKRESSYFGDETNYLRRHYWLSLDRAQDNSTPITQVLMSNIELFQVTIISDDDGKKQRHKTWPIKPTGNPPKSLQLAGIELSIKHAVLGDINRLYKVN